jgi:hypothetical protein
MAVVFTTRPIGTEWAVAIVDLDRDEAVKVGNFPSRAAGWLGLKIGVRAGKTDFGGKEVGCITFCMPPKSASEKAAEAQAATDDEIVW